MNRYFLITGATGLLGSYLMRDCLRLGHPIAALVRPSRLETARARMETTLRRWESRMNCLLPRPVVLEGDICREGLGLDTESRQWVRRNCHSILHNAASLTFAVDEATGEPWRSNFEGTRRVLEFAREAGIRQFHHVSTAYVCGLRSGTVYESELDEGQTFRNPYEESKLNAEKLVRQFDRLDQVTVYRPATIVGDSQTGYTTTYHGFYAPLKVAHSLVGRVPREELDVGSFLRALGLTGNERKNFVPVDWVSSVISYLVSDPSLHGRTYHVTPEHRVTVDEMTAALTDAVLKLSLSAVDKPGALALSGAALQETFRSQMLTYQSHWRDDPRFDDSNTRGAAPHLPCPRVDFETMWRLAQYAIENRFGWPGVRCAR